MGDALDRLTGEQRRLVNEWMPDVEVIADHSWKTTGTTVLEVRCRTGHLVVKAGDAADGHIERELRAHRDWLAVWSEYGRGPTLIHGAPSAKLVVTRFVPGLLVASTSKPFKGNRRSTADRSGNGRPYNHCVIRECNSFPAPSQSNSPDATGG